MSVQYGDQLVVHFLKPPKEAFFSSDEWPLHITLLPWFRIPEGRADELHDELSIIARRNELITAKTEGDAMFGRHRNIPVRLVGVDAFRAIHYQLMNAVQRLDGVIREPEITGHGYKSHITEQGVVSVSSGMMLKVGTFSLVEKVDTPHGDREVNHTYRLEG